MTRRATALGVLTLLLLAGCLGAGTGDQDDPATTPDSVDHAALEEAIGEPIELFHDHTDPSLHTGSHNLDQVSWSSLGVELGANGFANFVWYEDEDEDLAYVAIDGDTEGGFVIVDTEDPRALEPIGRYTIQGNGMQEVRVLPGGDYAIQNVQDLPSTGTLGPDAAAGRDCSVCLHLVDVSDRTTPTFVSALPVELIGTHNMDVALIDGTTYVFYVGQPLYASGVNTAAGNWVGIAQFVEDPQPRLVKVNEFRLPTAPANDERDFPHDVIVRQHPLTDQWIAYVSHWQGGAVTFDVSNVLAPQLLGVHDDPAPSEVSNIHWFAPEPEARGDRLIAYSAPEIGQLSTGSGVIRSYDVTNPANIEQLDAWGLPGTVDIPDIFLFSPHTTVPNMDKGLLAVTHYHAGVWLLDISDPTDLRHVAYHLQHGDATAPYQGEFWWKKPNFDPEGFMPNAYQARWKDDLLWVTERGTGMYVLEYTGPEPGDVRDLR